jgi:glycosyltransferase involved in cell wall biosynthesis
MPEALRVLDMQDFHALRLGRERLAALGAVLADLVAHRPDAESEDLIRELASIHRCDLTLAISEEERSLIVDRYGVLPAKMAVAPIGYENAPQPLEELNTYAARRNAMFIGNWRHKPNRDCARWLVQEVWPRIRQLVPDAELKIYGSSPTSEDMALTNKNIGVTVCGYCKDVGSAMRAHRLLVAPLRYGAGVKGKLTDAMRHGLVSVTTLVGAEGLGGEEGFPGVVVTGATAEPTTSENGTIEADAEAFAQAVARTYEDEKLWTSLQMRAHSYVSDHCNAHANSEILWEVLLHRWEWLPEARRKDFVGQILWQSAMRSTEWMAKGLALKEELRRLKPSIANATSPKDVEKHGNDNSEVS